MNLVRHEDLMREALAFLLERLDQEPKTPLSRLLDEAGMRYNLSPLDAERLARLVRQEPDFVRHGESAPDRPNA